MGAEGALAGESVRMHAIRRIINHALPRNSATPQPPNTPNTPNTPTPQPPDPPPPHPPTADEPDVVNKQPEDSDEDEMSDLGDIELGGDGGPDSPPEYASTSNSNSPIGSKRRVCRSTLLHPLATSRRTHIVPPPLAHIAPTMLPHRFRNASRCSS